MLLAALIGWIVLAIELAALIFGILLLIGNKRVQSIAFKIPAQLFEITFSGGSLVVC